MFRLVLCVLMAVVVILSLIMVLPEKLPEKSRSTEGGILMLFCVFKARTSKTPFVKTRLAKFNGLNDEKFFRTFKECERQWNKDFDTLH